LKTFELGKYYIAFR